MEIVFRTNGHERGIYYPETCRAIIHLNHHESLEDLYKTLQHEAIHHSLNTLSVELDDDQEERAIFCLAWAEEVLI